MLDPLGIHCHPFRIIFPNFFAPAPQRILLKLPFPFWHPFGSVLIPFGHPFGTSLVPIWFPFGSFGSLWLPLAPFGFLSPPFSDSPWNCSAFSYHVLRLLLRYVQANSAVAGPRLCRATRLRLEAKRGCQNLVARIW